MNVEQTWYVYLLSAPRVPRHKVIFLDSPKHLDYACSLSLCQQFINLEFVPYLFDPDTIPHLLFCFSTLGNERLVAGPPLWNSEGKHKSIFI